MIAEAVVSTYVSEDLGNAELRKTFYDEAASIIMSSEHRMEELLSRLTSVDLDEEDVSDSLAKVVEMSKDLRNMHREKHKSSTWQRQKTESVMAGSKLGNERGEDIRVRHDQTIEAAKQLERFMKKYPNMADQQILAEVIAFKRTLAEDNPCVLIASLDSGFFSPHYYHGGKSDTVTEEIYRRFGIRCDHPGAIFRMAGGVL